MKKKRKTKRPATGPSLNVKPEQAIEFLESLRRLQEDKDEKTELISIRVPKNLIKALKLKAAVEDKKYQSIIIHFIRHGLKSI